MIRLPGEDFPRVFLSGFWKRSRELLASGRMRYCTLFGGGFFDGLRFLDVLRAGEGKDFAENAEPGEVVEEDVLRFKHEVVDDGKDDEMSIFILLEKRNEL